MEKIVKQPSITQVEKNKIARYLNETKKRGYRPWVTVRQSHTIGQGQVIYSWKTKRSHHFLSRGELIPFFHFEHNPNVTAIYEQYPLPLEETMALAKQLNIVHPAVDNSNNGYVKRIRAVTMSMDYLVRYKDGTMAGFNFKYSDSLDAGATHPVAVARTEAKNRIEREFCANHHFGWTQLTEKSFDEGVTANLKFLRECFDYGEELDISEQFKAVVLSRLSASFKLNPEATVREVLALVATDCGIGLFQAQCLFQHFAYHRVLAFDWLTPINLNRPLPVVGGR